ncbi:MAG: hypothetical protein CL908_20965 [Deltaproteobacteria bacterium]|jgi:uncharacterized membrane protein|nr:hypothetical protein [Deltaproteobacteria bacterium]
MKSRTLRTTLRTVHVVAFSAYYGGHVFSVPAERMAPALLAVVLTGVLFMLFEISRAPAWVHQLRGVCTYIKLVLLASSLVFTEQRILLLTLIVTLGVVVSHAPSQFRYYSVVHRRVVETHGKG